MTNKIPGIEKMEKAQQLLAKHPEVLTAEVQEELDALAQNVETPDGLKFEKIQAALETTEVADADMIDQLRKLGMDPAILEKLPPADTFDQSRQPEADPTILEKLPPAA